MNQQGGSDAPSLPGPGEYFIWPAVEWHDGQSMSVHTSSLSDAALGPLGRAGSSGAGGAAGALELAALELAGGAPAGSAHAPESKGG